MNDSAPVNKAQGQSNLRGVNIHALDTLSLAALIPLSQAVFELADAPMIILSRLRDLVSGLCHQNREQGAIDLLYIIFGMLGTEYADAVLPLRTHAEARSYFLYGFTANLCELIEELTERSIDA